MGRVRVRVYGFMQAYCVCVSLIKYTFVSEFFHNLIFFRFFFFLFFLDSYRNFFHIAFIDFLSISILAMVELNFFSRIFRLLIFENMRQCYLKEYVLLHIYIYIYRQHTSIYMHRDSIVQCATLQSAK